MRGATGVFKVVVFCVSLLTGACVSSEQKAPEVSTSNSSQSRRVDFGDFAYNSMESGPRLAFFPKGRNQRSSYELIFSDPFTNTNNTAVHQFTVVPGICGNEQDRGDCRDDPSGRGLKSLRSELSENNHRGTRFGRVQPREASYAWEVGFPSGFPVGPRQTSGYYLFGQ